jgi:hypothetical protein
MKMLALIVAHVKKYARLKQLLKDKIGWPYANLF